MTRASLIKFEMENRDTTCTRETRIANCVRSITPVAPAEIFELIFRDRLGEEECLVEPKF